MVEYPLFMEDIGAGGVATLTLTRPDKHNAFNAELISELTTALQGMESDRRVRCVVLAAEGKSFSAGADLNWMRSMAGASQEENLEDARALARLMETLDGLAKPTVALVQGAAIGGGVGLVACCDIALASEDAIFALSEVRLGLIPAVIQPYVAGAIGVRAARRYTLTGERFDAQEAHRLGLVHQVASPLQLGPARDRLVRALVKGGPEAQREAKAQLRWLRGKEPDESVREDGARRIAALRVGAEGQEGISAFLEKRGPNWIPEEED